ncbi:MAG: efflux RND transporter periplasmic adaptor subunit [Planctomycetota bacterium]
MKSVEKPRVAGVLIPTCFLGAVLLVIPSCGPRMDEEAQDPHAHDAGHKDEVHLDGEQMKAAGVETIAAAPGTIEETLHLVARVASNENTIVHVTPRIDGIVQAIHKGLGEQVKAGDALAELWSVELGNTISAYLKARATVLAAEETLAKSQELYRKRLDTVTAVLDGEIAVARKIYEREQGLQEKGIATIRPYLEADKELQKAVLAKDRELTTLAAERDTRLLELDVALRQARIEETAAKQRLLVLGFDEQEIEAFAGAGHRHGRMVLRAPRDGVVLARHITLNEHVDTEEALFVIHDLSTVWVLASAYEKDLARLRPGQKTYVRLNALPGAPLIGEVSIIDYQVSATTRSASVRIELANEPVEGWPIEFPLRPGMFGEVEVVVDSRSGRVVLPEAAIVHEGEESFVFVQEEDEEGVFRRKSVKVRLGARDLVEIIEGVDPGEAVVVKGTFTLKSLARSEELGEGHEH